MTAAGEQTTIAQTSGSFGLDQVRRPCFARPSLPYLSPNVLERLVTQREPAALSLNDLVTVAGLPWREQAEAVFGREGS